MMSLNGPSPSNEELLATLLPAPIARALMERFESLNELAQTSDNELNQISGMGPSKAKKLRAAFSLAARLSQETWTQKPLLDSPEKVANLLREDNRLYQVERLQLALLNTRRRLIRFESISQGTLNSLLVSPQEVFRAAIISRASAIILVHNHPSGDPTPSTADITVTRELVRAGKLLKIDVLDHVILGHRTSPTDRDFISLREQGHIDS